MAISHVALVSQTDRVQLNQLVVAAAAIQKQIIRDFKPIWNIDATFNAFGSLNDVPLGYWAVVIKDSIPFPGAGGIHLNAQNGQPFALIRYSENWSLTVAHEVLEMLADPFGRRIIAAQSVKQGQGRVEYLVEVCDPCEAPAYAYTVNGVLVSDFYTPQFFDPVTSSVRYSFTGAIKRPLQVLEGGYLSWREPVTNHLWQLFVQGGQKKFIDRGAATADQAALRELADRYSGEFRSKVMEEGIPSETKPALMTALASTAASGTLYDEPTNAHAEALQAQIDAIMAGGGDASTRIARTALGERINAEGTRGGRKRTTRGR